jgi:hypothetical protein
MLGLVLAWLNRIYDCAEQGCDTVLANHGRSLL